MGLSSVHPLYEKFAKLWDKLEDVFEGQDKIKQERVTYLPALPSMKADGMEENELGWERYEQYILRANFPDNYSEAVKNNHGLLWSKPAIINLPKGMEYMNEVATRDGLSLTELLSLINEMQLRTGRIGLLLDMSSIPDPNNKPFISVYYAKNVRNWDLADGGTSVERDALNLLVLDESRLIRQPGSFSWKEQKRYRLLSLGEFDKDDKEGAATSVYSQGLFINQDDPTPEDMITPLYRGEPLHKIPFVAINASDCMIDPDVPPLMGLANLVLSMYISDADYRQHLYMQGQDTLVVKGGGFVAQGEDDKAPTRMGAGARIDVTAEGDVKYVGVESKGLEEERLALAADKQEAELKAGNMVNTTKGSQESGEALRTRIGARTASLVQLAKTGATGLEKILKVCAEWMGLNPEEVSVQPNLDFSKALFSGQNLVQTMAARNLGAPVSLESIHAFLADQGFTHLTFEEEMERIDKEKVKWPTPAEASMDQNPVQQAQKANVDTGGAGQQSQK
jgi:hypothetical protein